MPWSLTGTHWSLHMHAAMWIAGCSSGNWCGATSAHCGAGCQPAWSATGTTCNGIRVSSATRRKAAIEAAKAIAADTLLPSLDDAAPATTTALSTPLDAVPAALDTADVVGVSAAAAAVDSSVETGAVGGLAVEGTEGGPGRVPPHPVDSADTVGKFVPEEPAPAPAVVP